MYTHTLNEWGRMRSSNQFILVINLDYPLTYNAVKDTVLLASREYKSTAQKWDA